MTNFKCKKRGILKEGIKAVQLGNLPKEHTRCMIILGIQVSRTPTHTPSTRLVIKSCNQHRNVSQRWHSWYQRSIVMRHYQGSGRRPRCGHRQYSGSREEEVTGPREQMLTILFPPAEVVRLLCLAQGCTLYISSEGLETQCVCVSLFQGLYDLQKSAASSPS